jgi:hypothetical protein
LTRFCFYSTAYEQTIFKVSIGQQPYLTCFEVRSTGFEQLVLSASTAQIVDHFPFEQLIYNKKNIIFARIEINRQIFSLRTRTTGISEENGKHVRQLCLNPQFLQIPESF